MIKSLLKIGLLLVVGILGYNYFLGTPEEKAQSKEILGKAKDIGAASINLVKGEIQKFKSGKYDESLDKVGSLLAKAKNTAQEKGGDLLDRMEDWEEQKDSWQKRKDQLKEVFEAASDEEKEKIGSKIKEMNEEGERLKVEGEKLTEEIEK